MCSLHTYNPNQTVINNNKTNNNEEGDNNDDDDDIIIESKNNNEEETKEEEMHDDNNDDIIIESKNNNEEETKAEEKHNDDDDDITEDDKDTDDNKEDDINIADDDDDDDDNYIPNANKELDFSDDEEFLAELLDCSDEVIELMSKVKSKWAKGGNNAKGGNQHYWTGPKPPDTSRMTESKGEEAMRKFQRERKKWTDVQRKKRIKDGMIAADIMFTRQWRKYASHLCIMVTHFRRRTFC